MKVELMHHTPISVAIAAIRKCYDSLGKSDSQYAHTYHTNMYELAKSVCNPEFILGPKDIGLIAQVIESDHTSTLEHLVYTFDVDGISRGCLQEFARHRVASLSVKSSRYTLGRIKKEAPFSLFNCGGGKVEPEYKGFERASEYLVRCEDDLTNAAAYFALENLRILAVEGVPNDQLKYCLPEAFKTSLVWTINARSLRNFLKLRTAPQAHWEIRKLAGEIIRVLPPTHSILYADLFAETPKAQQ